MAEADLVRPTGSLRSAGLRNVAISALAAVSTYFSLTLVARQFGGSLGSDGYFFLLSLTTISTGVIGGIFAAVFLPIFVNLRVRDGNRAAGEFAGSLLLGILVLAVPIGLASHVFYAPFFARLSRFSARQLAEIRPVLIFFSEIFVISIVAEYFRVMALALGQYSLAAIGALFQPVLLIVAVAGWGVALGERSMSLALLTSKLAILALMLYVVLGRQRFRMPLGLRRNAAIGHFVRSSAPYGSANVVTNLATFYFDYLATGLGAGVLTSISYAQRIFALPVAVVLTPILDIARTQFAEAQAHRDIARLSERHNRLWQLVLYFSIPVSALMVFLPNEIIASMFQRGAFDVDSVRIAADCLRFFALSIPLTSMFMLNGRAVESFQKLTWPSVLGTLGNALMIGLTFLLVREFGYIGIPFARLGAETVFFLPFGFLALRRFAGRVETTGIGRTTAIAGAAALVPIGVYFGTGLSRTLAPHFPSMALITSVVAAYLVVYGLTVGLLDRRLAIEIRAVLRR